MNFSLRNVFFLISLFNASLGSDLSCDIVINFFRACEEIIFGRIEDLKIMIMAKSFENKMVDVVDENKYIFSDKFSFAFFHSRVVHTF